MSEFDQEFRRLLPELKGLIDETSELHREATLSVVGLTIGGMLRLMVRKTLSREEVELLFTLLAQAPRAGEVYSEVQASSMTSLLYAIRLVLDAPSDKVS